MISMSVGLQTEAYLGQRAVVYLSGCHDVRSKINQQIMVDDRRGTLAQAWTPECTRPFTIIASAKGFRESIRSSGSQEGKLY